MSELWDGIVEDVRAALGGVQGGVSFTDGELSGSVAIGEKRVLSWGVILAALVVGFLLGRAA